MIAKRNARDVLRPSRDRDCRALGYCRPSALLDLKVGCLRIFDIGLGTNGYDVSVRLFGNNFSDNGITYVDLISHRCRMCRGKLVGDTRPKVLLD